MSSVESDEALKTLQKLVDGFTLDVGRVRAALDDPRTPVAAKRTLVGALNYVLDKLDIVPDHVKGLGAADDAIVLRVAAALAVGEGADFRGLLQLAKEALEVKRLLGDELSGPLETMVAAMPGRRVKGRTADDIVASKDARAVFEADLSRALQQVAVGPIEASWMGSEGVVGELRKMVRHALRKGGFVTA
jgi:uncharacterized membrane protein YkvA (DUF1232 family)